MKKNVASQVIGVQMVAAADGTAFTGTATVVITVDGGTQSASGGTGPTHEGNGFHTYLPTQAETNGDHIGFTFTGSGAIPVTIQIYTDFPQTVDSGTVLTDTEALLVDTEAVPATISTLLTDTEALLVDTEAVPATVSTLLTDTEAILADSESINTDTEINVAAILTDTEAAITARSTLLTDTEALLVDTEAVPATISTVLTDTEAVRTLSEGLTGFAAIDTVVDLVLVDTEAAAGVITDTEAIITDTEALLVDTEAVPATISTLLTDTEAVLTDTEAASAGVTILQALLDDARAEPAQGAPPVNPDVVTKIDYLYKAWRNKVEQTATTMSIYNDAGTVVDHKATVSDDGTTAAKAEVVTGP